MLKHALHCSVVQWENTLRSPATLNNRPYPTIAAYFSVKIAYVVVHFPNPFNYTDHLFVQVHVFNCVHLSFIRTYWTCEDGASSWITAIPITDFGFNLHKQVFRDALCLRYGWPLSRLPSHCFCGVPFSINHAFTCLKGAFPINRHNRIRDLLADLLTEVCPCVAVEPVLQPLSGEQFQLHPSNVEDNARLNVSTQEL